MKLGVDAKCRRWLWGLAGPLCLLLLIGATLHSPLEISSARADDSAGDGDVKTKAKPTAKTDDANPSAAAKCKADDDYYELYKSLADTMDQIERNYVQPVDRRELMEAAIRGVLDKLDPYSNYISPEQMSSFRNAVESQFGGIGIQVTEEDGQLKVTSPLVGTPAYRAGVQAGDRIIEIEGKPTADLTIDEAVRKLKGEVGTSVTFTVRHALSGKSETFKIKRELIHVDTVLGDRRKTDDSWDFMLDPEKHIGYIRLTAFSRETPLELKKALENLQSQKLRGLILDLRFNPGGLLTSAVEVSDLFLSDGRIVSTKGRNTTERTWDAVPPGTFEGFPMVVLVNRYSASASEIVAACLQDHNRAVVIGERSWGKGSVQNVIELESGRSALKLTTASYARPNGHNIHRFPDSKESDEWGVKPNDSMEVKLSSTELRDLMDNRRQRDVVQAKPRGDEANDSNSKDDADKEDSSKEDNAAKKPTAAEEPADPKFEADKADEKPTEDKQPAEEKPADAKPADDKSSGERPTDEKPADKKSADDKSSDEKSGGQKTVEEKPADEKSTSEKPAEEKSAEKKSPFVDRQLKKAIDYLTTELAKAP